MKKTILVFVLAFLCAVSKAEPEYQRRAPRERVYAIARDIEKGGLPRLAERSDEALDNMLRVAVVNLRDRGLMASMLADSIERDWVGIYRGMLSKTVGLYGDIGDHKPLIQWLEDTYDAIEKALGVEVCKALHLSDIKTLNCAIPVVFRPCDFPMDAVTIGREHEYRNHFAKGSVYYGLVPVVTYWIITIGCWTGTSGAGSFVCALVATGAEWLMGTAVCPHLSDLIFEKVCHQ